MNNGFQFLSRLNCKNMQVDRYFDNPFTDSRLTAPRLHRFGKDVLERLGTEAGEPFLSWRNNLAPVLAPLGLEIGEVDLSLISQKGATQTADEFIVEFNAIMKTAQPMIQVAFKGKDTVGYKAFFPYGLAEYTEASKGHLDTLTSRLGKLATEHAAKLDPVLVGQLQELNSRWKSLEGGQSTTRKATAENRGQRSDARRAVEVQLLKVLLSAGAHFADNKEAALKFFDAALLSAAAHPSKTKDAGTPAQP